MDDEPDVRLVYPHPESDSRDDHSDFVGHEPLLMLACQPSPSGVVRGGVDPGTAQAGASRRTPCARGVTIPVAVRCYDVEYAGNFVFFSFAGMTL